MAGTGVLIPWSKSMPGRYESFLSAAKFWKHCSKKSFDWKKKIHSDLAKKRNLLKDNRGVS